MLIQEIRYQNLLTLVREANNNKSEVARRCDSTPAYIGDIIRGVKTPSGRARGVGDGLARKLEQGFNKPSGWMDIDHAAVRRSAGKARNDDVSEAEEELIKLAREFGLTEDFLRICRKHIPRK